MQQVLKARLAAEPAIGARLHWNRVPQGTDLPYVRLQTVSAPNERILTGYRGAQRERVQVDCFAKSWGEARAIARAIKNAMAEPATLDGVRFGKCGANGPRDGGEDTTAQGYIHRASLDLFVEYALV